MKSKTKSIFFLLNPKIIKIIIATISVVVFVLIWDWFAVLQNSTYLPRPFPVFKTLVLTLVYNEKDFTGFHISQHIIASLGRVFYGFLLASAIGVPIGLLAGWSRYVESAATPLVEIIRPIPPLAWIPFAIVFFTEPLNSIFIVFLGVFFPVMLSTIAGVKAIDKTLIDAAKTLGANRFEVFLKVITPASVPSIMTGMRIGLGIGWMCIVAAEFVGVKNGGLGLYIWDMSIVGMWDKVFAGMILIGIIGFLMVTGVSFLERRISKWAGML
jgi:NitT/TauT family transport system permease protein